MKRMFLIFALISALLTINVSALGEDTAQIDVSEIISSDLLGDLNLDDSVDTVDITIMKKYFLEVAQDEALTQEVLLDVNGDNTVTLKDIVRLKYAVADAN